MTDNELIADFMGYKYYNDYGHHHDTYYEEAVIDPNDPDFIMTPRWNESWDWLMPVVQKIDKEANDFRYVHKVLTETSITAPIGIVYERVVEFIKWHNEWIAKEKGITI